MTKYLYYKESQDYSAEHTRQNFTANASMSQGTGNRKIS